MIPVSVFGWFIVIKLIFIYVTLVIIVVTYPIRPKAGGLHFLFLFYKYFVYNLCAVETCFFRLGVFKKLEKFVERHHEFFLFGSVRRIFQPVILE